jgi:hypothetical protein
VKKQIVFSLLVALGTQQVAQAAFFVPLAQAGKDTASLASDYVQPLVAAAVVIGLANVVCNLDVFKEKFGDYSEKVSNLTNSVINLSGLAAFFTFCYYLEKTGKFHPEPSSSRTVVRLPGTTIVISK